MTGRLMGEEPTDVWKPTWEYDISPNRNHLAVNGDARDVEVLARLLDRFQFGRPNVVFAEFPGVARDQPLEQVEIFLRQWFEGIDKLVRDDAVLILLPRDLKGGDYLKSSVVSYWASKYGWKPFREYIAKWTQADFYRPSYSYFHVFVFRRGDRGTNRHAEPRYKDIMQYSKGEKLFEIDEAVQPIDPKIAYDFLDLVIKPGDLVLDPFAGTGIVAMACEQLRVRSFSVEIDPVLYFNFQTQLLSTFKIHWG